MQAYAAISLQQNNNLSTVSMQRQAAAQAALFTALLDHNQSASSASELSNPACSATNNAENCSTNRTACSKAANTVEVSDLLSELKDILNLQQLGQTLGLKVSNVQNPPVCLSSPYSGVLKELLQRSLGLHPSLAETPQEQQEFLALSLLLKLNSNLRLCSALSCDSPFNLPATMLQTNQEWWCGFIIPFYMLTLGKIINLRTLRAKRQNCRERQKARQKRQQQEREDLLQQFNECFIG